MRIKHRSACLLSHEASVCHRLVFHADARTAWPEHAIGGCLWFDKGRGVAIISRALIERLTDMRVISLIALGLSVFAAPVVAQAQADSNTSATAKTSGANTRVACIFDPTGKAGPLYDLFQPYVAQVADWGYEVETRVYADESVAAGDFRAGQCDMAILTGLRTIRFVRFAGSLDMVGGVKSYAEEKKAIDAISAPKAAKYMQQDDYEVAGVTPLGRSYLLARDRDDLTDLDHLASKRVAVLNYDKQAVTLADQAGLSPVPASTTSFGPMFTSGSVSIAYAPALAFKPLELYEGVNNNGGIAQFPLGMLSNQILIRKDRFADGFGQKSRTWVANNLFEPAAQQARGAENAVPEEYWVTISDEQQSAYNRLFRSVREQLWDDGWYNHRMQRLLKKIRCDADPASAECSLDSEGGAID